MLADVLRYFLSARGLQLPRPSYFNRRETLFRDANLYYYGVGHLECFPVLMQSFDCSYFSLGLPTYVVFWCYQKGDSTHIGSAIWTVSILSSNMPLLILIIKDHLIIFKHYYNTFIALRSVSPWLIFKFSGVSVCYVQFIFTTYYYLVFCMRRNTFMYSYKQCVNTVFFIILLLIFLYVEYNVFI